jgi:hypothetical protein
MPEPSPSSPTDTTIDAMPHSPEEDEDEMPALEASNGALPQIVLPELGASPATNHAPQSPPPSSTPQPMNFTAAQAYYLNYLQCMMHHPQEPPAAPGAAVTPQTGQSAPNNGPAPAPPAPSPVGGPNGTGAVPSEGDTLPSLAGSAPPGFQSFMQAMLAGPPPGFPGAAQTATSQSDPVPTLLSLIMSGEPYGPEDEEDEEDWEDEPPEDDDDMPPLEAAANASANGPSSATASTETGAANAAGSTSALSPWLSFHVHYLAPHGTPGTAGAADTPAQGEPTNSTATPGPDDTTADGTADTQAVGIPPNVSISVVLGSGLPAAPNATANANGAGLTPTGILIGSVPGVVPANLPAGVSGPGPTSQAEGVSTLDPGSLSSPPPWFGALYAEYLLSAGFTPLGDPSTAFSPPTDDATSMPDAEAFVDSLEQVDISTIPVEDMRCPHCWLDFGTTEDDAPALPQASDHSDQEFAERQGDFGEMPFPTASPNNDPVRTPCGHIFGRDCLIESLQKVGTTCPICRQELRPQPQVPQPQVPPPQAPQPQAPQPQVPKTGS